MQPRQNPSNPDSGRAEPRRILIVRLGAIGDVVNALTLAAAIKDQRPDTHIGWMVHPLSEPLVRDNPVIDRVHLVQRKGLLARRRSLRAELRAERYDLTIDLQRMQKSALLGRLAGAPRYLGYDRQRCKEGAWIWYSERIQGGSPHAHMVEQYAQFAGHLGIHSEPRHSLPEVQPEDLRGILDGAESLPRVIVHVGASKPENRWLPERYRELVQGLLAEDLGPVWLTGGPGDREDAQPTESALATNPGFRSMVGETSLRQLQAIIGQARLFVSCDTGPMHLAAALGVPVLALFGPADPRRTGPFGSQHRVLRIPSVDDTDPGPAPPASMQAVSSSDTLASAKKLLIR